MKKLRYISLEAKAQDGADPKELLAEFETLRKIPAGGELAGPLIVEEMSSTIFMPTDWAFSVGQYGGCPLATDS